MAVLLTVTIFGLGKIKWAPGTWGSLAAFPLAFIIFQLIGIYDFSFYFMGLTLQENYLITIPIILFISSWVVFAIGVFASHLYIKDKKDHDPSEVVIDEVAGQLLVIAGAVPSVFFMMDSKALEYISNETLELILLFLLPFALFRLFDITKPWPIKSIEDKFPNAFGIMIDDMLAAIFAIIIHYVIIFTILDFLS